MPKHFAGVRANIAPVAILLGAVRAQSIANQAASFGILHVEYLNKSIATYCKNRSLAGEQVSRKDGEAFCQMPRSEKGVDRLLRKSAAEEAMGQGHGVARKDACPFFLQTFSAFKFR